MFNKSPFWIKLLNWEYWPMNVTYIPVVCYFVWLSIRARSFGFWSAVNPGIQYGGMRGETKFDILSKLPQEFYPISLFVPKGTSEAELQQLLADKGLTFPIIGKPNIGERGQCVKKINDKNQLIQYHQAMNHLDYIIQSYVDFEEEYAIYHYRMPNETKGKVISVCKKGFLKVTGDGTKTIHDLMLDSPRAILQLERLKAIMGDDIYRVPTAGEVCRLGHIGNHILGTEFINDNHEIDEDLNAVFDRIEQSLDGVFMARYDLRCKSMEEMKKGKHIYIVEINGVGAEAAHIYDKNMRFFPRYKAMLGLWTIMYKIAKINKKDGHKFMSIKDILQWRNDMKAYYPNISDVKFKF